MDSDVVKIFSVMMAVMFSGTIGYMAIGFAKVVVRRLEGKTYAGSHVDAELADLRARLDEAEGARGRIAELEERLDFAERMLAQQREHSRLPGGGETR